MVKRKLPVGVDTRDITIKDSIKAMLPYLLSFIGVIFFVIKESEPSVMTIIPKCFPVAYLSYFVYKVHQQNGHSKKGQDHSKGISQKILPGLVLSALGDGFLIWKDSDIPFTLGLISFAVAQLMYIRGFGFERMNWTNGGLVFLFLIPYSIFVLKDIPGLLQSGVAIYGILISIMLWRAIDRLSLANQKTLWKERFICIGAINFVVSDASLALLKFVVKEVPLIYFNSIVLPTYYAAQMFIVLGSV